MTNPQNLKPISTELILERMKFENPWWVTGNIDDEYNAMQRRLYFLLFTSNWLKKQI